LLAFLVFVGFGYSQGWFSQIINPKEQNNQSVIENTVKSIVEVPKNPAPIESVQIETLESFPVQKILVLKGVFSDGCGFLEDPVQSLDGNLFSITLETRLVDPNTNCTQALVPFERKIDLMVNNLPGGTYNVRVNGQYEIQFILAEDNRIDFDAGESK